jgi:hypothetical protein
MPPDRDSDAVASPEATATGFVVLEQMDVEEVKVG